MEAITKIECFKIDGKLFETIKEANKYKFQRLDPVELGDFVFSDKGILDCFPLGGRVCRIDHDLIWFVKGNCPDELIMLGTINFGVKNYKHKGELYAWDICNRPRHKLSRKSNECPYV